MSGEGASKGGEFGGGEFGGGEFGGGEFGGGEFGGGEFGGAGLWRWSTRAEAVRDSRSNQKQSEAITCSTRAEAVGDSRLLTLPLPLGPRRGLSTPPITTLEGGREERASARDESRCE